MSGCFLWSIEPKTKRFLERKLRGRKSIDQSLGDCFCTVLGGANAYLDKFCQFEVLRSAPVKKREPSLIAFCYNQKNAIRKYDFYWLDVTFEPFDKQSGKSILRAILSQLPSSHSTTFRDGAKRNGVIQFVETTSQNGSVRKEQIPCASREDVARVTEMERTFQDRLKNCKSPAAVWLAMKDEREFQDFFKHIPASVERKVLQSESGELAFRILQGSAVRGVGWKSDNRLGAVRPVDRSCQRRADRWSLPGSRNRPIRKQRQRSELDSYA
jgi:hypothetical protein